MNVSRQDYIDYCKGSLSQERSIAIKEYLKENPLEKKALDGAFEYSKSKDFESLLAKIDTNIDQTEQIKTTEQKSTKARILPLRTILSLTSVAAIGLILFFLLPANSIESYTLDQYFDKYPDVLTDVVRGNTISQSNTSVQKGMTAYNTDNFNSAIIYLEAVPENLKEYETAKFYEAISHLANHSPEKSLHILNKLSQTDAFPYADGVQWYMALSYLELDQTEKANPLLKQISESNHYKSDQAKKLLMK